MRIAILIPTILMLLTGISHAQSNDLNAEVIEWVIDPCMQVAAAIEVESYDQEIVESGVKMEHIAKLMLASRDSEINDVVAKMKANSSWKERSAAYSVMLKLCLSQFVN